MKKTWTCNHVWYHMHVWFHMHMISYMIPCTYDSICRVLLVYDIVRRWCRIIVHIYIKSLKTCNLIWFRKYMISYTYEIRYVTSCVGYEVIWFCMLPKEGPCLFKCNAFRIKYSPCSSGSSPTYVCPLLHQNRSQWFIKPYQASRPLRSHPPPPPPLHKLTLEERGVVRVGRHLQDLENDVGVRPSKAWWFFCPQNSLVEHNQFFTVFFSMKVAELKKIVLVSSIIDFDDIQEDSLAWVWHWDST